MRITILDALAQLRQAVADGEIERIADDYNLEIVMLFGSAANFDPASAADTSKNAILPGDIDIAVGFVPDAKRDFLGVINALEETVRGDHLDIMNLDRAGPVAQKAAMFDSEVLYVRHPSVLTEREIRAFMMYEDTRWLRDLQTEALLS